MQIQENNIETFNIQRKIVANMTTESWTSIPHVSFVYEADITDFIEAYRKFDTDRPEFRLTFNTAMLKVLAEGIEAAPRLNGHMSFQRRLVRGRVEYLDQIDVSVPWTLPDGHMMTITMKDVGNKTLKQMAEYTDDINRRLKNTNLTEALYSVSVHDTVERLKKGRVVSSLLRLYGSKTNPKHRVTPLRGQAKKDYYAIPKEDRITYEDLKQGTITISNIGAGSRGIRGHLDMLMIIPPQIFAIGISALQRKPVVVTDENGEEKVEIRSILPMVLCFDHRALDFGQVTPFLRRMEEIFKDPSLVLRDDYT